MDMARVTELRHTRATWVVSQVLIVLLAVVLYFRTRGLTEGAPGLARAHARHLIHLEQSLHLNLEPSTQRSVEAWEPLETLANWIYVWGHWPVILAAMVWLVWRHRPQFLRLRDAMLVSGALGLVVFATYPVAPPRLAHLGYIDTVTEASEAYRYLQPPAFVNQYAALPSLHVGWDLLVCLAVFSATRSLTLRVLACAMPVLMAWAVVATANHFVLDVVAGVAFVMVGHAVALALERRRDRHAREPA